MEWEVGLFSESSTIVNIVHVTLYTGCNLQKYFQIKNHYKIYIMEEWKMAKYSLTAKIDEATIENFN